MKVSVDYDLCESNALCEALAPSVFEVDDDDQLQVQPGEVAEADLPAVRQAVAACPKAALKLVSE